MSFAQKDQLNRIRHTSLLTTEKNFIENKRKMQILEAFFERQQLIIQPNITARDFTFYTWHFELIEKKLRLVNICKLIK
jgi:hypothetical protein